MSFIEELLKTKSILLKPDGAQGKVRRIAKIPPKPVPEFSDSWHLTFFKIDKICVYYEDNGKWNINSKNGFGLELVDLLTTQMEGTQEKLESKYKFKLKKEVGFIFIKGNIYGFLPPFIIFGDEFRVSVLGRGKGGS